MEELITAVTITVSSGARRPERLGAGQRLGLFLDPPLNSRFMYSSKKHDYPYMAPKTVVGRYQDRNVMLPPTQDFELGAPSTQTAPWPEAAPAELAFSSFSGQDRLRVLIIGAGFAGLSAAIACARQGFSVTLLERSSGLSPHGDAITVGSNAAKILYRWGLGGELWDRSAKGGWWLFKDSEGKGLSEEDLREFPGRYGAPVLHGHRAQFLGSLGVEARFLSVRVRLEQEVVEYFDTPSYPAVVTKSGEIIEADVILVADGVNSISRELLAPRSEESLRVRKNPSEYSIHRAAMKSDAIKNDKLTAHLLDGCTRTWIGKDAHAVITPLDDGRQIAFSLTHHETVGKASLNWRDKKPIGDALSHIKDWDPVLKPAAEWISGGGAIAFLGDSVHPMTTTTFQGGSMAIEDAAVLGIVLGLVGTEPPKVRLALQVFHNLRKKRVAAITTMGVQQRANWHSYTRTKDPAHLQLLTLEYYGHDAELHALSNFEALAAELDPTFRLSEKRFEDVLKASELEAKTSKDREGRLFRKSPKPRQ